MSKLNKTMIFLASMFFMMFFANSVSAAAFVCTSSGTKCNSWAAITATQKALQSTDPNHTTVDDALSRSSSDYVKNAYASQQNLNLYLKKDLWHAANDNPQHLTAYIYNTNDLTKRLWSCHISAKIDNGKYPTDCEAK